MQNYTGISENLIAFLPPYRLNGIKMVRCCVLDPDSRRHMTLVTCHSTYCGHILKIMASTRAEQPTNMDTIKLKLSSGVNVSD